MNADGWVIIKDLNILGGEPVFRDTRVPFKVLIDYLEGGDSFGSVSGAVSKREPLAITAIEEARQSLVAQTQVKVLIDECAPKALKRHLTNRGHECVTVQEAVGLQSRTANFRASRKLLLMFWSRWTQTSATNKSWRIAEALFCFSSHPPIVWSTSANTSPPRQ